MYLNSKICGKVWEAGVLLTLSNGAEGPLVVSKERISFNFFNAISAQANLPTKCKHPQTQKKTEPCQLNIHIHKDQRTTCMLICACKRSPVS